MPELGAIHEDVGFDWLAAGDLAAEMRSAATALEAQVAEREVLRSSARSWWQGRFGDEFDLRAATGAGDAGRFVTSLRDAADRLDELARLAREEQDRRAQAREWEASQAGGGGGLFGSVPVVGDVVDTVGDLLVGEDAPPPPPPVEPPAIPIGDPGVSGRDASGSGPAGPPPGGLGALGAAGVVAGRSGDGDAVSSARPADLEAWAAASRLLDESVLTRKGTLDGLHTDFTATLTWGSFDASSLFGALGAWLSWNEADARWVSVIALAFTEAGTGTLADAAIEARLDAAGLDVPRPSVTYDDPRAWGEPPTAGWADDPVNTASGNFVLAEVDLPASGLVRLLQLARTYNSRSDRGGAFGPGWSSWASVRLVARPDGAHWTGPDGQELVVPRGRDGGRERSGDGGRGRGDDVVHLRVVGLPGRVVAEGEGLALLAPGGDGRVVFGSDGRPLSAEDGPGTEVRFGHDTDGRLVTLRHAGGRTVTLCWDATGRRVVEALCSGGRRVRYRYDEGGRLVEVHGGPGGRRRYEVDVDTGRVVAVTDADGVVEARNTYDDQGRVVAQLSPHGRRTRFRYLPGRLTVVDTAEADTAGADTAAAQGNGDGDGRGPVDSYLHDEHGRLVGVVDALGGELTKAYDRWGNPVRVTDRDGTTTRFEWSDEGRLLRREAPDGSWFAFAHDDRGRVVRVEASTGAVTTLLYEGDERHPAEVVDPEGGVTRLHVEAGLVRRVVDADGVALRFGYGPDGDLLSVTDAAGNVTTVERDAAGRVTAVVTPMGRRAEIGYDPAGRPVVHRGPDGAEWRFEWSPAGRLVATVDPLGARRELARGPHGDVEQVVDELGHPTLLRYDELGRRTGVVLPDGAEWALTHDHLSRLTGVTDPTGATWRREHDATGRLVSATDPVGATRRVTRDGVGRVAAVDDGTTDVALDHDELGRVVALRRPDGAEARTRYDRCGRVVALTDPGHGVTHLTYTPAGRLAAVTSPTGRVTRYEHDRLGRLAAVVDPAGGRWARRHDGDGAVTRVVAPTGEITRFRYDPAGRVAAVVSPAGGTTRYEHDPAGRPVAVTDPTGGVTRFRWDAAGRLVAATDPLGHVTRYEHTARGLLAAVVDPLGGRVQHRHDAAGRLVERRDQLGRSTHWEYDAAGRPTRRVLPTGEELRWWYDTAGRVRALGPNAGDERVRIERDERGRPVAVDEPGAHHELSWDRQGRLIAAGRNGTTLTWRYDADGRVVAVGYPDGRELELEHDAAGRVRSAGHPGLGLVLVERDAAGRPVTRRAGDRCERWLHRSGLLVAHEARDGGRSVVTELEHDAAGRVVAATAAAAPAATGAAERTTYDYDAAGQLVATRSPSGGGDRSFRYDEAGRLVGEHGPGGAVDYRYDAAHQLVARQTAGGTERYGHDGAGRRVSATAADGTERTYDWDWRGRLAAVDGTHLGVDALGDLADVDGMPLLWDPTTLVPALRWLDGTTVVGDDRPWATVDRAGTGGGARTVATPTPVPGPDPWGGGGGPSAGDGVGFGYRGELEVEGLVWLRHRAYDPATRSFLSPDPLPGVPGHPCATHPYHYAGNDPVGAVDPLGLRPMTEADLAAYREAVAGNGLFDHADRAWDATTGWVADNWEYIAAGAMVVAGGALILTGAGVVLGGALLAGGVSIGTQRVTTGQVDWRQVGVDMVIGGASAGAASWAGGVTSSATTATWSTTSRVALQLGASTTVDVAGGMVHRQVTGQNPFDLAGVGFDTATGLAGGGLDAARVTFRGPRPGTTARTVTETPLGPGVLGETDWWGDIRVQPGLSGAPLEQTLRHEAVHSALSPTRGTMLDEARMHTRKWLYKNSHLYEFAEEALAEGFGTGSLREAVRLPFAGGYGISPVRVGVEAAGLTGATAAAGVGLDSLAGD